MRSSFSTCSRKAITMYKQTCTNLLELSSAKVTEWLSSFDSVITDCDGKWVVGGGWCGGTPHSRKDCPQEVALHKDMYTHAMFSGRHLPKYVSNRKVRCVVAASRISMSKSEVRDMAASRLSDALITHIYVYRTGNGYMISFGICIHVFYGNVDQTPIHFKRLYIYFLLVISS